MARELAAPRLPAGATLWAAFSGGLDSTVLLHRLKAAGLPVKALHVNHNLQQVAARWVEHCRGLAAQLQVPIYVLDVKVDPNHAGGPEAAAREARHGAFLSVMKPGDVVATAHHQDDQAETVLLRLLRGSGVAGLAAMRARVPFGPGTMWRPLLRETRAALRAHADRHGLAWVEDPHNLDPRYARSYLRAEIFPRLRSRWPAAVEQLARTAELCAEAVEVLDEVAARDLKRLVVSAAAGDECLSVRKLLALPPPRRNNALRRWAAVQSHEPPGWEVLRRLEPELLRARPDASPVVGWGESEIRRYRDEVHLMARLPEPPAGQVLNWDGLRDLELPPGCGRLIVRSAAREPLALEVRFGEAGQRLKAVRARHTRTLKNLFQEAALPPWQRVRMPLLHHEGALGAVGDRWQSASFGVALRRSGLRYEWRSGLTTKVMARRVRKGASSP